MSDLDRFKEMLDRAGVDYDQLTSFGRISVTVCLWRWSPTRFGFDEDGNLVDVV